MKLAVYKKYDLKYAIPVAAFILAGFLYVNAFAQVPYTVRLTYESGSYAPEDYSSHAVALLAPGSSFRVSASIMQTAANGTLTFQKPSNFIYQWYLNGSFMDGGRNKSSIVGKIPPRSTEPQEVRLRLEDLNGRLITISTLSLPVYSPKVLLFESNDEYVSRISQTEFSVKAGGDTNIIAQPFFFSVSSVDGLTFGWTHNNAAISGTGTDPRILTVNIRPDVSSGEKESFSVDISNPLNTFETVSRSFTVKVTQ